MRGATDFLLDIILGVTISIHAPARGATRSATTGAHTFRHFNPRTPCGVRQKPLYVLSDLWKFQSTHPLRGATCVSEIFAGKSAISIHAPLAGCDFARSVPRRSRHPFQSTHPLRGATLRASVLLPKVRISIHAPLAGCDFPLFWRCAVII